MTVPLAVPATPAEENGCRCATSIGAVAENVGFAVDHQIEAARAAIARSKGWEEKRCSLG